MWESLPCEISTFPYPPEIPGRRERTSVKLILAIEANELGAERSSRCPLYGRRTDRTVSKAVPRAGLSLNAQG